MQTIGALAVTLKFRTNNLFIAYEHNLNITIQVA
jgi:hypothetical protein|tara:strand:+ start:735 stop:836 length:102 start_codon:yes stop_codon:yes gene_type:complete